MIGALVLRPEPGNAVTATQLEALGMAVLREPLFQVVPLAWRAPSALNYDALLLTSANAARLGGEALTTLAALPVAAVGEATAASAREAGLTVALVGEGDGAQLVAAARAQGFARLLHLAGRDRTILPGVDHREVYASEPLPIPLSAVGSWCDRVGLLHSARAARRFAELVSSAGLERHRLGIAALSAAVAQAAGSGWGASGIAERPTDAALVAAAAALIDPPRARVDKRGR